MQKKCIFLHFGPQNRLFLRNLDQNRRSITLDAPSKKSKNQTSRHLEKLTFCCNFMAIALHFVSVMCLHVQPTHRTVVDTAHNLMVLIVRQQLVVVAIRVVLGQNRPLILALTVRIDGVLQHAVPSVRELTVRSAAHILRSCQPMRMVIITQRGGPAVTTSGG